MNVLKLVNCQNRAFLNLKQLFTIVLVRNLTAAVAIHCIWK